MFGIHLPNPIHAIERVGSDIVHAGSAIVHGAGDLVGDAGHWIAHNWKAIASIAVSTLAFAAVIGLCAICPFAIPGIVALAAAGFASGVAFYGASTLLNGRSLDWKAALIQGGLSAVITVATAGVGRVVAPALGGLGGDLLGDAVPPTVTRVATNTVVGAAFGTATQGVENLIQGKPLGDHLGDAAALGAINGLLVEPANRIVGATGLPAGDEPVALKSPGALDRPAVNPLETPVASEPVNPGQGIPRQGLRQRLVLRLQGKTPVEVAPPAKADPIADLGQLADQSPALARDYATLEAEGWKFVYETDPNKGTYADYSTKTIAISETQNSTLEIARSIAHEMGHAVDGAPPRDVYTPGMTRDEYIEASVRPMLLSEGAATLENVEIEQQILKRTGYDIGVSGQHAQDYMRIALDPTLSREQKISQIADIFAHGEVPSGRQPDGTPYQDYFARYAEPYEKAWDDWMASRPHVDENNVSAAPSLPPPSPSRGFIGGLR